MLLAKIHNFEIFLLIFLMTILKLYNKTLIIILTIKLLSMRFKILYIYFITIILLTSTSSANPIKKEITDLNKSMEFIDFVPCLGTSSICGHQLLAIGTIDENSADKLRSMKPIIGTNIYFHAKGDNILAAIKLGLTIRELRLNTVVGNDYSEQLSSNENVRLVENGFTNSAASFAFLGGVRREILNSKSFKVHKLSDDLVLNNKGEIQRIIVDIYRYLDFMGIKRDLLDEALLSTSKMPRVFRYKELKDLKIYNSEITRAFPEEINMLEKVTNWRLNFGENDEPILYFERDTYNKNGIVSLIVNNYNNFINFRFRVQWRKDVNYGSLISAFGLLSKHESGIETSELSKDIQSNFKAEFCSIKSDDVIPMCSEILLSKENPYSSWNKIDEYTWETNLQISSEEFLKLIKMRPEFLVFECKCPNVYSQFDFCDPLPLDSEFWKLAKII